MEKIKSLINATLLNIPYSEESNFRVKVSAKMYGASKNFPTGDAFLSIESGGQSLHIEVRHLESFMEAVQQAKWLLLNRSSLVHWKKLYFFTDPKGRYSYRDTFTYIELLRHWRANYPHNTTATVADQKDLYQFELSPAMIDWSGFLEESIDLLGV